LIRLSGAIFMSLQSKNSIYEEIVDPINVVYEKRGTQFIDPYTLNKVEVRIDHFSDARFYDLDCPAGYSVQHWRAKKSYNKWLRGVRHISGMQLFRRPFYHIDNDEDESNKYHKYNRNQRQTKLVKRLHAGKNKPTSVLPQSADPGLKPGDENFRPKMFTEAMGKQISKLRTQLGMTQGTLASKIYVHVNVIKDIERGGVRTFNSEDPMVRALYKILGITSLKYD